MLIKKPADSKPSEITPESVYRNRREFMKDSATMAVGAAAFGGAAATALAQNGDQLKASAPEALHRIRKGKAIVSRVSPERRKIMTGSLNAFRAEKAGSWTRAARTARPAKTAKQAFIKK